jgi:hypothetical protein
VGTGNPVPAGGAATPGDPRGVDEPAGGFLRLVIDGAPLEVAAGHSLAAALVEAGRPAWRRTRRHREWRGVFCGIGVCFDCLVTLNGTPGVRACLVDAADGDVVTAEHGSGFCLDDAAHD